MTLREQCEAFEQRLHGGLSRSPAQREDYIQWLEQFARQQQAVGLREAAEEADKRSHFMLRDWYERQAREREGCAREKEKLL